MQRAKKELRIKQATYDAEVYLRLQYQKAWWILLKSVVVKPDSWKTF